VRWALQFETHVGVVSEPVSELLSLREERAAAHVEARQVEQQVEVLFAHGALAGVKARKHGVHLEVVPRLGV
jgi:hypothetical protein